MENLQKKEFIYGPLIGNNACADVRRIFFDLKNKQILDNNQRVKYLFYGDSLTELMEESVYFPSTDGLTINRGISGDIAAHMKLRFEADVIQLSPENLILLAGTNDLAMLILEKVEAEEIVEQVFSDITYMVEKALNRGIKVFLCSIPPTNSLYELHKEKKPLIIKVNEMLKNYGQKRERVVFVDYYQALVDEKGELHNDYTYDGLHFSAAGYKMIMEVLKKVMEV